MNDRELRGVLETVDTVMAGMTALLHPNLEGVLHDVGGDRIVRLWNPYSGRVEGGQSLLDAETLLELRSGEVMGPYEQVGVDGRPIASVSVPLMEGRYLLCVNIDRTAIVDAIGMLEGFVSSVKPQPPALFDKDWRSGINQVTDEWCRNNQRRRDSLTRAERMEIVGLLEDKGLFATRHAAAHAAKALGVSRATIYTLLKGVRDAGGSRLS